MSTEITTLPITAKTVDDLTAATSVADTDLILVYQGGVIKKAPVSLLPSGGGGGGGTPVTMDGTQKTFFVDGVQGTYVVSGGMCTFGVWVTASGNPTLFGKIWSMPLPVTKPSGADYTFYRSTSPLCDCYMGNDGVLTYSADSSFDSTWVYLYGVYPVSGA